MYTTDVYTMSATARLNFYAVTTTETVNVFLGNNNCTCVEMDCQRKYLSIIKNLVLCQTILKST